MPSTTRREQVEAEDAPAERSSGAVKLLSGRARRTARTVGRYFVDRRELRCAAAAIQVENAAGVTTWPVSDM